MDAAKGGSSTSTTAVDVLIILDADVAVGVVFTVAAALGACLFFLAAANRSAIDFDFDFAELIHSSAEAVLGRNALSLSSLLKT